MTKLQNINIDGIIWSVAIIGDKMIPDTYRIPYMEQSQLPYLRWKAKETFGIDMKFPSHIKLLLERK